MSSITTESTNGHDPVAEHPIIKQLLADVAAIKHTQADQQQSIVLMHGLLERMYDRQEHLIQQSNIIVTLYNARGDTGAREPPTDATER